MVRGVEWYFQWHQSSERDKWLWIESGRGGAGGPRDADAEPGSEWWAFVAVHRVGAVNEL